MNGPLFGGMTLEEVRSMAAYENRQIVLESNTRVYNRVNKIIDTLDPAFGPLIAEFRKNPPLIMLQHSERYQTRIRNEVAALTTNPSGLRWYVVAENGRNSFTGYQIWLTPEQVDFVPACQHMFPIYRKKYTHAISSMALTYYCIQEGLFNKEQDETSIM